jgi:1-acyl-sn-glycerol-3-phosphate acyltransferase
MEKSCMICPQIFWVLSVPVFIILYALTTVTVIILLPFAYISAGGFVRSVVAIWAQTSFLIMLKRLRISGKHYLKKGQRYILLANHSSLFDILAIMAFYPGVSWFGKEYLVKIPVFGMLLKMINYVPMKASDLRNTREMIARLAEKSQGHTVAIFPEGTRTTDGNISKFRKGFLHLMRASELSLVPVTLNGFYSFKPKNRFYINFGSRLGVTVHEPINPDDIRIEFPERVPFHVDGELFFDKIFNISLKQKAVNFIYNSDGQHFFHR